MGAVRKSSLPVGVVKEHFLDGKTQEYIKDNLGVGWNLIWMEGGPYGLLHLVGDD